MTEKAEMTDAQKLDNAIAILEGVKMGMSMAGPMISIEGAKRALRETIQLLKSIKPDEKKNND